MAVVKADGYGHGLVDSAKAALAGGATFLGVAFIDEAVKLRDAGITAPILAWLTPPTSDFKKALDFTIDLSISSLDQLNSLLSASNATGVTPRVHLKVDTGMTRAGALDEFPELVSAIGELLDEEKLVLVGTWSHLACADEPTHPLNQEQHRRFLAALDYMESEGINPGIRHLANSGAVTHFPEFNFDMVRSGLLLYGYFPGGIVNKQIPIKTCYGIKCRCCISQASSCRSECWIWRYCRIGVGEIYCFDTNGLCRWNPQKSQSTYKYLNRRSPIPDYWSRFYGHR